jgi:polyhydroxyalkanoate synthesis regulator phasin
MSCKGFPVFLLILMLIVIGLGGCKESINSKDQIITQKLLDDCEKSQVKSCDVDAVMSRTESYCSTKGLSEDDCTRVKIEMVRDLSARDDKKLEEENKKIDALRKRVLELERQNQEADRVLRK